MIGIILEYPKYGKTAGDEQAQLWAEQGFLQRNNSRLFLWHLTQEFWAAKLEELVVKLKKKDQTKCIDFVQSPSQYLSGFGLMWFQMNNFLF